MEVALEETISITAVVTTNPFTIVIPNTAKYKPPKDKFGYRELQILEFELSRHIALNSKDDGTGKYISKSGLVDLAGSDNAYQLVALDTSNFDNFDISGNVTPLIAVIQPVYDTITPWVMGSNNLQTQLYKQTYRLRKTSSFVIGQNLQQFQLCLRDLYGNTVQLAAALPNDPSKGTYGNNYNEFFYIKINII